MVASLVADESMAALQKELDELSDDMRRAQLAMQTALLEMQRVEERRKEIEQIILCRADVQKDTARHDRAQLQGEVAELRTALALTGDEMERTARDRELAASALALQLEDAQHGLAQERLRNTLLQQELHAAGYPVVGCELSEGAPYDIAGVWIVSVVKGGPADKAGVMKGDVISEVAGIPVPTREAFRRVVTGADGAPTKPGHQVSFRIHREDSHSKQPITMCLMVTLGWSSRKPEGRRAITVTRTDKAAAGGAAAAAAGGNCPAAANWSGWSVRA
eukprot:Rhum_TRINITY_DN3028_c0_g1::Rhum_TRINITY_DN3028_c0_g1_i1::g.9330::m.9330